MAVTMVPGARIELATPAFSGRRSTGELPRHVKTYRFQLWPVPVVVPARNLQKNRKRFARHFHFVTPRAQRFFLELRTQKV